MNQKLNTWLCKHFDKETEHISDYGGKTIIPRKGYVTIWDIILGAIIYPVGIAIFAIMCALLVISIPGIFITNQNDTYQIIINGIKFWIVIIFVIILIYILKKIVSYKVAICPLVDKTEGKSNLKSTDGKFDLKRAEDEMFKDILKEE